MGYTESTEKGHLTKLRRARVMLQDMVCDDLKTRLGATQKVVIVVYMSVQLCEVYESQMAEWGKVGKMV